MKLLFWLLVSSSIILICNADTEGVIKTSKVECNLSQDIKDDIASYADKVTMILNYFKNEFKGETYKRISNFVDDFGTRLTGTDSLERSIDQMVNVSKAEGLTNVQEEEIDVEYWIRGKESATMLKPRVKNLPMLGLGSSIGTPAEGITAKAIVVKNFEELNRLSNDEVNGKIVVYDQPYTTYGQTVRYRNIGASEASKKGAVAALVRSIAPFSIATPHTGVQEYEKDVKKIPVAAITLEDADFLRREQDRGHEIELNLKMSATVENRKSRNVRADLEGTEKKDRVVLISGHIDSWDVGDGSMDDAGGFFISWLAPVVLKKMGLVPKRTLRAVLFTAEEQALHGAIEYHKNNEKDSKDNLVFLMESDSGTFAPKGLNYEGSDEGQCMMKEILKLFQSINANELVLLSPPAPDISLWTKDGFPGVGFHNDNGKYFWFHHTEGDALNVLDSDVLDMGAGFWTAVAYIVSDMKYEVPRSNAMAISSIGLIYMFLIQFFVRRFIL